MPIEFRLYLADVLDSSRMKAKPGPTYARAGRAGDPTSRGTTAVPHGDWSKPRIAARRM